MRPYLPVLILLSLLSSACGNDGAMESEDYGNLLASPAGLVLVEEEHPTGYRRSDCMLCHESRSIHTVNRTDLPSCSATITQACLDLDMVNALVRQQGEASCIQCHGDNGVVP